MRVWEIKNILDRVVNDENTIDVNYSTVFWGQGYKLNNFDNLLDALSLLENLSWNDANSSLISWILMDRNDIINSEDFNSLNSYIDKVNEGLPYYYSVLEELNEEQDEQTINIKLSEKNIENLKDLSDTFLRLDKIFKTFNIDGQFEYRWLDKGSTWLVVVAIWTMSYRVMLAALKISREVLEQKKIYWEWKRVELDYKTALNNDSNYTKEGLDDYVNRRVAKEIEERLKEEVQRLEIKSTKSKEELESQLTKGINLLIEEVKEHQTEFYLSLNPPSYIQENWRNISIDYKLINTKVTESVKQITWEVSESV